MSAEETIRNYYDALRTGSPLAPYFADDGVVVKVGISEYVTGPDAVATALREQTQRTTDWTVESRALEVAERKDHAWFGDRVRLAWRDTIVGRDRTFDTRWTGTLESETEWAFVSMHVSASHEL